MKIIFDYDHTLFDMTSMHDAIYEAMEELGISRQTYQDVYNAETHWKMFTVKGISQRLEKSTGTKFAQIASSFENISEDSELFVYDDVHEACKSLKDQGHDLLLLSWGDEGWQKKKIENSGVSNYFDEIITAMDVKTKYLEGFCEETCDDGAGKCKVVVVDDKPAELLAIKESNPLFHLIRIKRSNGKYSDQPTPDGMHEAVDMKDVLTIVESLKS